MPTKHIRQNTALYVRVSREDGDDAISDSIINQEKILMRYVSEHGYNFYNIYADDGFTATNLNRPGWNALKRDIEAGIIDIVLAKDSSRLTRDYADFTMLAEDYFPVNKVRFIAVSDSLDTSNGIDDAAHMRAFFNAFSPRDTSKKVKATLRTKAANGEFIGSVAPYGYKKSVFRKDSKRSDEKIKLIPNEETKHIVKKIFDMYVSGNGYVAIAKELNSLGIPSPSCYNKQRYGITHSNASNFDLWSIDVIRKIILNPVYIGDLVQHKEEKLNIKSKVKKAVDREKRIIVRGSHEPLIDKSVFDTAQALCLKKALNTKTVTPVTHLLSGFIFCGVCGSRCTFSKSKTITRKDEFEAICSKYKRYTQCERHAIYERDLERMVLDNLKSIAKTAIDSSKMLKGLSIEDDSESAFLQRQIEPLQRRLKEIDNALKSAYIDKANGQMTDEVFKTIQEGCISDKGNIAAKLADLNNRLAKADTKKPVESYLDVLKEIVDCNILTKQILLTLVDRIEIHPAKIVIKYNFKQP